MLNLGVIVDISQTKKDKKLSGITFIVIDPKSVIFFFFDGEKSIKPILKVALGEELVK